MFALTLAFQGSQSSGGGFIQSVPHDASAVLVYVLVAAFVALLIKGSRNTPE